MTSYTGETLMDLTAAETVGRALGFAPARAGEMFEAKNAVMNAKTVIDGKRQALLSRVVKARLDGDTEQAAEIQAEIIEWNKRNPDARITPMNQAQSMRAKRQQTLRTKDGINLPRKREELRDIGRFAAIE